MTNTPPTKTKTVAIIEGWAGGPRLSKKIRQSLVDAGFQVISNCKMADIIVAHSTGCYFIPKNLQAMLVILINPPYWPGQSIIRRFIKMTSNETKKLLEMFGRRRLFVQRYWEVYYFFKKPLYTYSVLKNQSHLEFLQKLTAKKVILIHNEEDEFCSPEIKKLLNKYENLKFVELPGFHSDYYTNPEPYIKLIESSYGRG